MRIAILTSGILPVPAVLGGAVENLVDFYLEYNDEYHLHDMTVYSVWHPDVERLPALKSEENHYVYIKVNTLWAKIKKKIYQITHGEEYYHYTIEFYLNEAIKDILKKNFDMIIIENRPGYALKLKKVTSAKIIYHLHNDFLHKQVADAQGIYDAAKRILTVSDYIKRCVETIDSLSKKTITVYNGIDLSLFKQKGILKRYQLGFCTDDFIIVFSGRVNSEKGILELIEAMALLKDYPRIKLLVIGSSFFGNVHDDDIFTGQLKARAESLEDRITFTGFIPYSHVPDYMLLADIAVLPSMWEEPFGLTVVEAMAAGLPLVTTRSGGIPEICEGVAIIIEKENIIDNLAKAIIDLFENPEKRKQMSKASLERSKMFDKEIYAKNFFTAIEE